MGLFVCHTCDNRLCINPDHLFLGTADDNTKDMNRKGRAKYVSGINHYKHKLTTYQLSIVKTLYYQKFKQHEIAKMFGVQQSAISRIINNVRRKIN